VTDWMTVKVVLERGADTPLAHPPGRVLLVHADHTFADLAEAIDVSFGRWDLDPGHVFEVEGRTVTAPVPAAPDAETEDSEEVAVGEVGLRLAAHFRYVFDPGGGGWVHGCTVEGVGVDPFELHGEEPESPVPLFGWGALPDQYGRLTEDDEPDEEAEGAEAELSDEPLESWEDQEVSSWTVVDQALGDLPVERDDAELASAAADLRAHADNYAFPYDVLWAAGGFDDQELPDDDAELWLALAAGVVSPRDVTPLDAEREAAWAALEPADWAGAVIELVRGGVGQSADPDVVLDLIARCPEVESEDWSPEDEEVLLEGLETVVALWQTLGALDEDRRLTVLGRWGLAEALRVAWAEP
jgi:hypothetical protein